MGKAQGAGKAKAVFIGKKRSEYPKSFTPALLVAPLQTKADAVTPPLAVHTGEMK